MSELDFNSKTVLVVGGSSGIGNGIAHGFLSCGAEVHVWSTRASADDYDAADGSNLSGLNYSCVDVSDHAAIAAHRPAFDSLDVLVLSQGVVRYGQEEFNKPGWDYVMDVNIDSVMACASKFQPMLADGGGSLIIVSSISGMQANISNPAYAASKAAAISLTKTLAGMGTRWYSR